MQRDFDEALLRARLRPDAEDEETGSLGAQLSDHPAPATLPWVEKLSSTLSQAPVAGSQTFQSEITAVSAGEAMAGTGVPAVVTQQQAINCAPKTASILAPDSVVIGESMTSEITDLS